MCVYVCLCACVQCESAALSADLAVFGGNAPLVHSRPFSAISCLASADLVFASRGCPASRPERALGSAQVSYGPWDMTPTPSPETRVRRCFLAPACGTLLSNHRVVRPVFGPGRQLAISTLTCIVLLLRVCRLYLGVLLADGVSGYALLRIH